MADQLCTTADVKVALKIADTTDDVFISSLIDGVSDWIIEYTGRQFVPTSGVTYIVDTAAGGVIHVPRGIRAVTTLGVAATDQPDTGGTYTTVAAASILLRPSGIWRKPGWPATEILVTTSGRLSTALNGASILGDFGFSATPPAINRVAIDAVSAAYQARRVGGSGVIGADGDASTPWTSYFAWGSPQRQTLMRYRAGSDMGIG